MTVLTTPKINKVYRRLWVAGSESCYLNVSAEGTELLTIHFDGTMFRHALVGWCSDCAFGECDWPQCPKRFPQQRVPDSPTPIRDQDDSKAAETVEPFRAMPSPPEAVEDIIHGPVEPVPVPAVELAEDHVQPPAPAPPEQRSRLEQMTAWGPGPGAMW